MTARAAIQEGGIKDLGKFRKVPSKERFKTTGMEITIKHQTKLKEKSYGAVFSKVKGKEKKGKRRTMQRQPVFVKNEVLNKEASVASLQRLTVALGRRTRQRQHAALVMKKEDELRIRMGFTQCKFVQLDALLINAYAGWPNDTRKAEREVLTNAKCYSQAKNKDDSEISQGSKSRQNEHKATGHDTRQSEKSGQYIDCMSKKDLDDDLGKKGSEYRMAKKKKNRGKRTQIRTESNHRKYQQLQGRQHQAG